MARNVPNHTSCQARLCNNWNNLSMSVSSLWSNGQTLWTECRCLKRKRILPCMRATLKAQSWHWEDRSGRVWINVQGGRCLWHFSESVDDTRNWFCQCNKHNCHHTKLYRFWHSSAICEICWRSSMQSHFWYQCEMACRPSAHCNGQVKADLSMAALRAVEYDVEMQMFFIIES